MASRRRIGLALLVALALVPAACGVPSSSPPIVDGGGHAAVNGPGFNPGNVPPGPDGTEDPVKFVDNYLRAVAGRVGNQQLAATAFMTAKAAVRWQPQTQITVIRHDNEPSRTPTAAGVNIDGNYEVVGVFDPDTGTLNPPPAGDTRLNLKFDLVSNGLGGSLRVDSAPNGMFMLEDVLRTYYLPHLIYFWDPERTGLIPDLRYIPDTLSPLLQATLIVKWVLGAPSVWMNQSVSTLFTDNTTLRDPTVRNDGDTFIVNLSSGARAVNQTQLLAELRWSFGSLHPVTGSLTPSPVELQIENQTQTVDASSTYSAAYAGASRVTPIPFAIGAGKVRLLDSVNQIPVLNDPANTSVVLAAISQDQDMAALVRQGPAGVEELWVRRIDKKSTSRFAPVRRPCGPGVTCPFTATSFTRPVWLAQPAGELAIVADGNLYLIDTNGTAVPQQVVLPNLAPNSITAFSVAPEGHRIAFIANHRLFVAVFVAGARPALTPLRYLNLSGGDTDVSLADGVAWSAVDQLVVAGESGNQSKVVELSADGGQIRPVGQYGSASISQIVSYPYSPLDRPDGGLIMVQASDGAYGGRASTSLLTFPTVPAPTVSASGKSPGGHTPAVPTSPFFLD